MSARDWNTNDPGSGFAGFVTSFDIPIEYYQKFEVQNVGGFMHEELWVPADELDEFNSKIIGGIKLLNAFLGKQFIATPTTLKYC